jgi:hypothetical protein
MSETGTERRYTLADIDRMRGLLRQLLTPIDSPYYEAEISAKVEDHLRTYMQAGIRPEKISDRVKEQNRMVQEMRLRLAEPASPPAP